MEIETLKPATLLPQHVLDVLRDNMRQDPYALADDPMTDLIMTTSVGDWRDDADLLPWRELGNALNIYWNMDVSRDDWKRVLTPENRKTVGDVCELIAANARIENVAPPTLFGRECVPAGLFLAVRELLARDGADVTELSPSSSIRDFAIKHPCVFVNEVSRLAPGYLPPIKIEHPTDQWSCLFVISWILLMISLALSTFAPFVWIPILLFTILAFAAQYWTARMDPTDVQFGDLVTFRDLCNQLTPGIRT